jgi:regulator of protease activity HflC (stomatin/prohibitin superfamily)
MNIKVVLTAIAGLSWIAVVVLLVLTVVRASRRQNIKPFTTGLIVALVLALLLNTISAGLVFIQPDQRGVVISAIAAKGYREQALQPGLRWIIPYAETVTLYSISRETYTMSIIADEAQVARDDSVSARTLDGQEVLIDASVIFAIDPAKVIDLHIAWQNRYSNDLIRPLARGVIRDAVSQFRVEEVVSTKRFELQSQIEESMSESLSENGLLLVDFVLRNITFSAEYAASVEQKQIAEQQAQQAKFVVEQKKQEANQAREVAQGEADAAVYRAEGDAKAVVIQAEAKAEARVIQAKAEAEALQLIANVLKTSPSLLTYQYIEKLSPGIKVMLVPSDNPYLLPLPDMETGLP